MGKKKAAFDEDERSAFLRKFTRSHQEKKKMQKKKPKKVQKTKTESSTVEIEERTEAVYKDSVKEMVDERTGEVVEVNTVVEVARK